MQETIVKVVGGTSKDALDKKAERLNLLFQIKPDETEQAKKKNKQETLFISSAFVRKPDKKSINNPFAYFEPQGPIVIDDRFDQKRIAGQKYRQQKVQQSFLMSHIDENKKLFQPRNTRLQNKQGLMNSTNQTFNEANNNEAENKELTQSKMISNNENVLNKDKSFSMEILNDKIKSTDTIQDTIRTKAVSTSSATSQPTQPTKDLPTPHASTKQQELLEQQRLDDLPQTIEEIDKLKEENIIVQYKGGRQIKGILDSGEKKAIDNVHQRQISCFQEFNNLDMDEKMKTILSDDQLQYISYTPTYDNDLDPKNLFQPLLDFSSLSRDLLIQHNSIKQSLVQNCIEMLRLDDVLINKKNITLHDITNIVSERINQNQLKYIFTTKGVYELAKQIIKDEPSEVKKKFSKANAVVSENIDYINEIKDVKKVDSLKAINHYFNIAGYKDQGCQVEHFEIAEQTKEELDWVLEDFYFIRQAKLNVDTFPSFFEGVPLLQKTITKRFEDTLIDILRIFLGVSSEDYYEKRTVSYKDLMCQLKEVIKNPESICDEYVQGQKKIKILHIILDDLVAIIEKEETQIEQIKSIHKTLSAQKEELIKQQRKPSYIKDYEKGTIETRKHNQNKIFSVINTFKEEKKVTPFKF